MRTSILAALLLTSACAADDEPEAATPDAESSRALPQEPGLGEWRAAQARELARVEREQPARVAELRALAPVATRDGAPRFASDALRSPDAAPVLIDRLAARTDPPAQRVALVAALPSTGGAFAAALVGLVAEEPAPEVRAAIMSALRRGAGDPALAGLRGGLGDADASVRLAAIESASRRPDGATLAEQLLAALADRDADVQVAAIRALGALRVQAAFGPLKAGLSHTSAEVRLHALRALGRIDARRTSALPELVALVRDSDERVAAAAEAARRP